LSPSIKGSSIGVAKVIGNKVLGKKQETAYKTMQDLLLKQSEKYKQEGSKP